MSPLDLVHKLYEERNRLREAIAPGADPRTDFAIIAEISRRQAAAQEQTSYDLALIRADRDRLRAALAELLLSPAEATTAQIGATYDLRQVECSDWEAAQAALAASPEGDNK